MADEIGPGRVGEVAVGMRRADVEVALGPVCGESTVEGLTTLDFGGLRALVYEDAVTTLVVESPEVGSTVEAVTSGMRLNDLVERVGELTWDDDAGAWAAASTPGIWYEIARPPAPGEDVHQPPLERDGPPLVTEYWAIEDPDESVLRAILVM